MTDIGYFGPDSVTWRVHSRPLSMIGGLRALLLQALDPEAMALLEQRSDYRRAPMHRLQRTVDYVMTVSFGATADVDSAAARVRAVHAALGIDDPRLLAWVHVCEVDSFVAAARRTGVLADERDIDRYVGEQAIAAKLVGVPDVLVPRTHAELRAALSAARPGLRLTRPAVVGARYVLAPPLGVPPRYVVPARLAWSALSTLAVGMLPGWARRMYRLPPTPGSGLATTAALRTLSVAVDALPQQWREGPNYRAAKARTAS